MKRISGAVFSSSGETIPLIDIGPSFSDDASAKEAVAADIGKACREIGFFQITNHGISSQARQGVMEQARRFFHDLPQAKKDALHIKYSKLMRGYEPSGVSNVNPDDWKGQDGEGKETKEAYNWGYEPGLDATGGDGNYVELDLEPYPKGANVWPSDEDLPGLFDAIRQYHSEVLTLARHLAGLFALSLDLPESHFDKMMTHPGTIARLLYYPPQKPKKATAQDEEIGLGAHTDYECFTLLFSSETPGLEVLSPNPDENGRPKWISAPAHQDCFTVNIADFFERWTNGLYKSTVRVRLGRRQYTVHRVVNRSPDKERYSVPFFFSINYDEMVSTLPTCISEDNPSRFNDIQAGPYTLERLRATLKDAADEYHKK
ncbi:uncharacterized protein BCR38DRAFT_357439 [Pseudomassariella vexata]|uniref:Fe2OG dioxygenase domain-containing protein n=1 Tax=Pseudomassariella vexata TaxID=1141098 RepID=A0A1Y2D6N2_9PEZI|nr:uncharacterized protein BCR38DRAFT_357439 [Pseudomassariella vexata]ORY54949.1 hypothetical protein BCR38DRAFT_357439 [Pseudomassariella vexata]